MFPEAENPFEGPEAKALRSAVEANDDRFIPIQPLGMEAQTKWMNEFVKELGDRPMTQALQAALMSDRPMQSFSRVVRAEPAWRGVVRPSAEEVERVIIGWQTEHGLTFPISDVTPATDGLPSVAGRGFIWDGGASRDVEQLRRQLHEAIDQMPLADLLKLSVPLEYLVESRESDSAQATPP